MHVLDELPAMIIDENKNIFSGYHEIIRGLKDSKLISLEPDNISSLSTREFLFQLNKDLLIEEFNDEEIFRNFTEPALLTAKCRYYWNFIYSRIYPLNHQISLECFSSIKNISV